MIVSRIYRHGRVQYGPGSRLGPRDTIGHEFVRILMGRVLWTCDGITHQLGPGSFVLSQPGHREEYRWDTRGLTRHDYVHFDLATEAGARLPPPGEWPVVAPVDPQEFLHSLFQHLIEVQGSGHPQAIEIMRLATEQMLLTWVHGLRRSTVPGGLDLPAAMQAIIDLVYERWRHGLFSPPPLSLMIQHGGISRSALMRLWDQRAGMGPVHFFEGQRLHFARLLLLETNRNITGVAERLGYPNPFHFSRNFKARYGLSPRVYRERPLREEVGAYPAVFHQVFAILSGNQTV